MTGRIMLDLNGFIDPLAGWTLTSAQDINNHGKITGFGTYQGQQRAYLLTPDLPVVPVPAPVALGALGMGLVALARRVRRTPAKA